MRENEPPQTITSVQNPRVRFLRALQDAQARAESGCFLAEGVKLCREALRDAQVLTLLCDADKAEAFAPLIAQAPEALLAPARILEAIGQVKTSQGILAAVRFPAPLSLDTAGRALLALDGVQDPGNVGTMLRTAEAAGFSGALLSPACADVFSPKAVRASMGSVLRLPVWRGPLPDALSDLKERGYRILSADLHGEPLAAQRPEPGTPFALVIGSEGSGVSAAVSALADARVTLPMRGRAESLNAAVAAGILMYGLMGM
ncbi:23S rRNA methyltransferase [Clostridia bacterium]|nr:23S rRNA methyltransferase [Clostridia bacterium]